MWPATSWIPGFTFMDLGPDGGPYDESAHSKGCVHSTEGTSLAGAESAYKNYPPHAGYDPNTDVGHQYIRLERHSLSFNGGENDDEFIVQIEIVGRAAESHTWPELWYQRIGERVIAPLREILGIPDVWLRFYRQDEGIVLASPSSPIRLSDTDFRAFSGWLGHQHVPAPDAHWDPGGFLMDKAIAYSRGGTMADSDLMTSAAFRTEALAKGLGNASGGPDKGEVIHQVRHFYEIQHNQRAFLALAPAPQLTANQDGTPPAAAPVLVPGKPIPVVKLLQDLAAKVDALSAKLDSLLGSGVEMVPETSGELVTRLVPKAEVTR